MAKRTPAKRTKEPKTLSKKLKVLNVVGTLWDVWPTINAIDAEFDARYVSFYAPWLQGRIDRKRITLLGEKYTNKLLWPFKLWMRTRAIRKLIAEWQPDYVIGQHDDASLSLYPTLLRSGLAKGSNTKRPRFIAWVRADPAQGYSDAFYTRIVRWLARKAYSRFDLVITPSKGNQQKVIELYGLPPAKVAAVYNPIDLHEIAAKAKAALPAAHERLFKGGKTIVTLGRLTEQKGQWHLLRAFATLRERLPEARLVVIGEGELRDYLEDLAISLGIADRVHFVGFQQNPYAYFTRADLFVLPSLWETFGNALLEAMACGTPVVSTNCRSGPIEILADSADPFRSSKATEHAPYGVLVPALDGVRRAAGEKLSKEESLLAQAMLELLNDARLRAAYAKKAKARAAHFDISRTKYLPLFAAIGKR